MYITVQSMICTLALLALHYVTTQETLIVRLQKRHTLACKRTIVDKMDVSSGAKSAISHLTADRQYYLLIDYKHMIVNVHATENYTNSNILEQISKVESILFGNQHEMDLFVRK